MPVIVLDPSALAIPPVPAASSSSSESGMTNTGSSAFTTTTFSGDGGGGSSANPESIDVRGRFATRPDASGPRRLAGDLRVVGDETEVWAVMLLDC